MNSKAKDFRKDLYRMKINKYLIDTSDSWKEYNVKLEYKGLFKKYYKEAFSRFYSKHIIDKRKKNELRRTMKTIKLDYNNGNSIHDSRLSHKFDSFVEVWWKND